MMIDFDRLLAALLSPYGGPGHDHERLMALEQMLLHPRQAHPRLLELADTDDPPTILLATLSKFSIEESVPTLTRAFQKGADHTTVAAGQALAEHAAPAAFDALIAGLASERDQVVASAADGLATRRDRRALSALQVGLRRHTGEVRERLLTAIESIEHLGNPDET